MVENLDSILNFTRLCRCCGLEHNLMYDIFSSTCSNAQTYCEVIMECSTVQLNRDDGLPSLVCRKCVLILESFVLFRSKCLESEFIFKQIRDYIYPDRPEALDSSQDVQDDPTVVEIKEESDDIFDTAEPDDLEKSSASEKLVSNDENWTDSQDERTVFEIETCLFEDPISANAEPIGDDRDEPNESYSAEKSTYKPFEQKSNLAGEQKIRPSEELYSRDAFTSKSNLDGHRKIHTRVTCNVCDKPFTLKFRQRDQETRYSCDECTKSFADESNSNRHRIVRRRERPYSCDRCEKTFFFKWILVRHQRNMHTFERFSCSKCPQSFESKSHFDEHWRTHTDKKPHTCDTCGKSFDYRSCLDNHKKIHTGVKPYSCDKCGKSFISRWKVKRHQSVHNGRYSCSVCHRSFEDKSRLDRHRKSHADKKMYACDRCGKQYDWESSLVRHQRTHPAEKPYACSKCDKSFVSSWKLNRHQNVHRASYSCSECRRSFKVRSDFYEHKKTHADDRAKNRSADRDERVSGDRDVPVTETTLRKSTRRKSVCTLPVQKYVRIILDRP